MPNKDPKLANAAGSRYYHKQKIIEPGFLARKCRESRINTMASIDKYLLRVARRRAKKRNIPFDIELCDIRIPEVCPVFGTPFVYGTQYSASLDKIVPALGYVKGNIQVISTKANTMKSNASLKELREFSNWVNQSIH